MKRSLYHTIDEHSCSRVHSFVASKLERKKERKKNPHLKHHVCDCSSDVSRVVVVDDDDDDENSPNGE